MHEWVNSSGWSWYRHLQILSRLLSYFIHIRKTAINGNRSDRSRYWDIRWSSASPRHLTTIIYPLCLPTPRQTPSPPRPYPPDRFPPVATTWHAGGLSAWSSRLDPDKKECYGWDFVQCDVSRARKGVVASGVNKMKVSLAFTVNYGCCFRWLLSTCSKREYYACDDSKTQELENAS